jgi:K+-transporting ATPase ATPase C chain
LKEIKGLIQKASIFLMISTILCGVVYTLLVTTVAQGLFHKQANGSIIEVNGEKYGSVLLAQEFNDQSHLWGRLMIIDTSTFKDKKGNSLQYAGVSNLSPTSDEFQKVVSERIAMIKEANPTEQDSAIPVDLVTCSASGLDPHISVAAAEYQIDRIVSNTGKTKEEVEEIIKRYTTNRFLGFLGEPVVNVLEVNLALDGIL